MKKIFFIALLFSLLLAPSANASIPSIQQTTQYKNLKSYVTFLQSESTTPVSPTQKATYQNNLNAKSYNTQKRVVSLYTQRKTKIINTYKRNLKKAIKNITSARNSNLSKAKNAYLVQIDDEKAFYQSALQGIYNRYDPKIAKVNKSISKTKKQIAKSNDPVEIDLLRTKLSALQSQKGSLWDLRATAKQLAFQDYKDTIKEDGAAYTRRVKRINARADQNISSQYATRQAKKESYLSAVSSRRAKESLQVATLVANGQAAIDSMPPLSG